MLYNSSIVHPIVRRRVRRDGTRKYNDSLQPFVAVCEEMAAGWTCPVRIHLLLTCADASSNVWGFGSSDGLK